MAESNTLEKQVRDLIDKRTKIVEGQKNYLRELDAEINALGPFFAIYCHVDSPAPFTESLIGVFCKESRATEFTIAVGRLFESRKKHGEKCVFMRVYPFDVSVTALRQVDLDVSVEDGYKVCKSVLEQYNKR